MTTAIRARHDRAVRTGTDSTDWKVAIRDNTRQRSYRVVEWGLTWQEASDLADELTHELTAVEALYLHETTTSWYPTLSTGRYSTVAVPVVDKRRSS